MALPGCSGSKPSEKEAKKVILDKIAKKAEGRIKLVSFCKTNGQESNMFGVRAYAFEYEAEIEFTEDCIWTGTSAFGGPSFATLKSTDRWLAVLSNRVEKGHREKIKGEINFEMTEKGWRVMEL